ncbi:formylglycine-generating enzyme family protein [Kluyvera ascorbata]|uniref:formylglycine-generating enzyme family protein n=1 Tax=Kluyvera ascorbata TaxID=51288 RepID=UPI0028DF7685|nr:SUMF1/EgtB/PvdO family nonheme iron enzyme [Kluyvera ascorbata]MDT8702895.1 SUMF1/EgtB/PvdO family nonheme iron enzyme [Kluyvera ascorbata]
MMQRTAILGTMLPLLLLQGCDQSSDKQTVAGPEHNAQDQAQLEQFIQQIKSELVYVQGGEFLMGDFGEEYGQEKLPYDSKKDSKPLHRVELSSYSISKFKASNQQYNFYLKWNGLNGREVDLDSWKDRQATPDTPAHVNWNEAQQYCFWLGKITDLPFSLPTEAQWEYAARSRGDFVVVPTDNGYIKIDGLKGINIAMSFDRKAYSKEMGTSLGILSPVPGNYRPPNPLGIYDMAGNGWEWMKDWYDPVYYSHSPTNDPQGPEKPVFKDFQGFYTKVLRGQDLSGPGRGFTMVRRNSDPESRRNPPVDETVRCAINSQHPIK